MEDYLRLIHSLESDVQSAMAARLSRMLDATPATVSATLRRLAREGLLYLDEDRAIRLTPVGLIAAEVVTRHHRLVERFLSDLLHVPWRDVYALADRMEHTISPRIERQLQVVLANPTHCPHGNPIHPSSGPSSDEKSLSRVGAGPVSISRIQETAAYDIDVLEWLESHALMPGTSHRIAEQVAAATVLTTPGGLLDVPRAIAQVVMVAPVTGSKTKVPAVTVTDET